MMENEPYSKNPTELEQSSLEVNDLREFKLWQYPDGREAKATVARLKPFKALAEEDLGIPPEKLTLAYQLIDAFDKAEIPSKIADRTIKRRPHLLIAGGFVRDVIDSKINNRDKTPKDIDFATNTSLPEAEDILRENFGEALENEDITVDETGKQFGVLRIKNRKTGEEYEIAAFRVDSVSSDGRRPDAVRPAQRPGKDAGRRDLTINALFYNPRSGTVIDYVGGLRDIKEKVLRFIGDPEKRIKEDYLRALRYVRFLVRTDFKADKKSEQAIAGLAAEAISNLPAERIVDELNKALKINSRATFELYRELGLLKEILPEMETLTRCEQGPPYHMEGNVFEHTMMVLENLPADQQKNLPLQWAAAMHDIAKPDTRSEESDEKTGIRVRFLGHEEKGVATAANILKRLKFSNDDTKHIIWLIANHSKIFNFLKMKDGKARNLLSSPYFKDLVDLGRADALSYRPHPSSQAEGFGDDAERLFEDIREKYENLMEKTDWNNLKEIQQTANGHYITAYAKERGVTIEGREIGRIKNMILKSFEDQNITDIAEAKRIRDQILAENFPDNDD